jgi:hypothetical protein
MSRSTHRKTATAWRPHDLVLSALSRKTRVEQLHTRARGELAFHGDFYGREFFAAKLRSSVQRGANPISRDTWRLQRCARL